MMPRERVLAVLLRILSAPYIYTKRDLAEYYGMSKRPIKEDIEAMVNIGLQFDQDDKYRCAILPSSQFRELKHLQSLSETDKYMISNLLDQYKSSKEALYLKNKLNSLYDFQKLGLRALRRPALDRLEILEKAKAQKLQAVLINYRSNSSNSIKDRTVEVFHIDTELDTIQAYDVDKSETNHFRLSRIERVRLTDQPWNASNKHQYKYTDVFRIADNNQIAIHLKLQVYAYNVLIEHYPKAISQIMVSSEPNIFDFETQVNHKFLGLMGFILGNYAHIEIVEPQELRKAVKSHSNEIIKKNNN